MEKKHAPPVVADINVTPMVDVMLVLLIIFMVITPMLTKGQTVEMVRSKNTIAMQAADKEDAVLVAVTRDGRVFLSPGNKQLTAETLPEKVRDLLTNKLDKTVFIKADARSRYEKVEDVIDNLRAAGVDQLGLLTEQIPDPNRKPGAPPPAGATPKAAP
jgi:biopolymer transport protein ExbD/biopolymer transport protein TolR